MLLLRIGIVDDSHGGRDGCVVDAVCWGVVRILHCLVEARGLRVKSRFRSVHGRMTGAASQHLRLLHGHLLSEVVDTSIVILGARGLEDLGLCCAIVTIGAYAVELEANASRTRPRVGGCCIALDLPPPASFTGSHYWNKQLVLARYVQKDHRDQFQSGAARGPYP